MTLPKHAFLQISFSWLFGLLVGAAVLFFAIFFAVKLLSIDDVSSNTLVSRELGTLLNPLETGYEDGSVVKIALGRETRLESLCSSFRFFGEQTLRTRQERLGEYGAPGFETSSKSNYVFMESLLEGNELYAFNKPFSFPYKVASVTMLLADTKPYCFVDAPEDIAREIANLNIPSVTNATSVARCPPEAVAVCFGSGNVCNVYVSMQRGEVRKGRDIVSFGSSTTLMYGAIFSDKETYECQVKRLMLRAQTLADLYAEKQKRLTLGGCQSSLDLQGYSFELLSASVTTLSASEFDTLEVRAKELSLQNNQVCPLW